MRCLGIWIRFLDTNGRCEKQPNELCGNDVGLYGGEPFDVAPPLFLVEINAPANPPTFERHCVGADSAHTPRQFAASGVHLRERPAQVVLWPISQSMLRRTEWLRERDWIVFLLPQTNGGDHVVIGRHPGPQHCRMLPFREGHAAQSIVFKALLPSGCRNSGASAGREAFERAP